MPESTFNLIKNSASAKQGQLTVISSQSHNGLYKKIILGSLLISFSFIPTVATVAQDDVNTNANVQYKYNADDKSKQNENLMNNFTFKGYNFNVNEYNLSIDSLQSKGSEEGIMKSYGLSKQIKSNISQMPKIYKKIEDNFTEIPEKILRNKAASKEINSKIEYGGKIIRRI